MVNTPSTESEFWWEMQWKRKRGWQVGWKQSGWQLFARLIRFVAVGAKGFWHNCVSLLLLSHTHRGYMCFAWNGRARALVKYCSHAGPMRHNASSFAICPRRLDFFVLVSGTARRKYNKLHNQYASAQVLQAKLSLFIGHIGEKNQFSWSRVFCYFVNFFIQSFDVARCNFLFGKATQFLWPFFTPFNSIAWELRRKLLQNSKAAVNWSACKLILRAAAGVRVYIAHGWWSGEQLALVTPDRKWGDSSQFD